MAAGSLRHVTLRSRARCVLREPRRTAEGFRPAPAGYRGRGDSRAVALASATPFDGRKRPAPRWVVVRLRRWRAGQETEDLAVAAQLWLRGEQRIVVSGS